MRMEIWLFWTRYYCAALGGANVGLLILNLAPHAGGVVVLECAAAACLFWNAFGPRMEL